MANQASIDWAFKHWILVYCLLEEPDSITRRHIQLVTTHSILEIKQYKVETVKLYYNYRHKVL